MAHPSPSTRRDPLPAASRYELLAKIASGGMASVHVGRLRGAVGFWRLVAVKRAHAHLLEDPELRRMLIAEAHLASRIHHPNVVAVLDVEQLEEELLLVMDYVEGAALSELAMIGARTGEHLPPPVALRIALDACAGLHAAHELTDEDGNPLGIIHRDISPQNILVGVDGLARITDFGIAKCAQAGNAATNTGALKGKVAYMAPEYINSSRVDARCDVFGLGVVTWEALANQRLFRGQNEMETLRKVLEAPIPKLSEAAPWIGDWLDDVMAKVLERAPERRFPSARAFADALEAAARAAGQPPAAGAEVSALVRARVGTTLEQRRAKLRDRMAGSERSPAAPTPPPPPPARTLTLAAPVPAASAAPAEAPPEATHTPSSSSWPTIPADAARASASSWPTIPVEPAHTPVSARSAPLMEPTLAAAGALAPINTSPPSTEPRDHQAPELTTLGGGASAHQLQNPFAADARARRRRTAIVIGAGVVAAAAIIGVTRWSATPDEHGAVPASAAPSAAPSASAAEPHPSASEAATEPPPAASASASASASSAQPVPIPSATARTNPRPTPNPRPTGGSAGQGRPLPSTVGAPAPNPYATKKQ